LAAVAGVNRRQRLADARRARREDDIRPIGDEIKDCGIRLPSSASSNRGVSNLRPWIKPLYGAPAAW
jgi:hypothetical protein